MSRTRRTANGNGDPVVEAVDSQYVPVGRGVDGDDERAEPVFGLDCWWQSIAIVGETI